MKVKDLIAALQEVDGEMDVVVRTPYNLDIGDGWSYGEYEDHDIKDVYKDDYNPCDWIINPNNKQVIVIIYDN